MTTAPSDGQAVRVSELVALMSLGADLGLNHGWCWQVSDVPGGGSRLDVAWDINPRTFWRRALFARLRRAQLADEVPRSLAALAQLVPAVRP